MATICTHIVDGTPVTEVVEDGVVRSYDPATFERFTSSGTVTEPTTAPRKGRAKPGDRAKLGS